MNWRTVLAALVMLPSCAWCLTLEWDANPPAENVVAYRIHACADATDTRTCKQLGGDRIETMAMLDAGTEPTCYAVTAVNQYGLTSDYSERVCVDYARPGRVNRFAVRLYVPVGN